MTRAPSASRVGARTVAEALLTSPFRGRAAWPLAVVVVRLREAPTVTDRATFAHWLASNDLPELARECRNRKVRPGAVLVFVDVEAALEGGRAAGLAAFTVIDVRPRARRGSR
jgi:beta-phosphoglucomutase-like phosphatase (HAD superfamily)